MKIFLSWSGPRSRAVAEALNDWLRRVIQAVKPFYSPEMEKGAKWSNEIDDALAGTHFGIVCLTPDNLESTWIHFETGALSKTKDALIWTFLHGLSPADVPPPLGKFQHTIAKKDDTLLLLRTINRRLGEVGGEPLTDNLLEDNFDTFWPQLEKKLIAAEKLSIAEARMNSTAGKPGPREERAILDEILELVRNQERRFGDFEDRLASSRPKTDREATKGRRFGEMHITIDPKIAESEVDRLVEVLSFEPEVVDTQKRSGKAGHVVIAFFYPALSGRRVNELFIKATASIPKDALNWEARIE